MPLLKPFSSVTTYNNSPTFDEKLAVEFCPFGKEVSVEINITTIVNKWLNNTLTNYGLVVKGHRIKPKNLGYISFGSAYSNDNTLIPTIDVYYKQNFFCLIPPPPGVTYTTKLIECKK